MLFILIKYDYAPLNSGANVEIENGFWKFKDAYFPDFSLDFISLKISRLTYEIPRLNSFISLPLHKALDMAGINKVILVGNLGKDPEMRILEGGMARVSFSLATTEVHKDKNGNRIEHTEWHNIVLWRHTAENAEKLLKKGSQIYLEGKLQTRNWQDKDGIKRQTTEIVGEIFQLLGRKESFAPTPSHEPIDPPKMTDMNGGIGDVPF